MLRTTGIYPRMLNYSLLNYGDTRNYTSAYKSHGEIVDAEPVTFAVFLLFRHTVFRHKVVLMTKESAQPIRTPYTWFTCNYGDLRGGNAPLSI